MSLAHFHPAAQEEFEAAAEYYERQTRGLGDAFVTAVEEARRFIGEFPRSGSILRGQLRRVLVRRFPYALIYVVDRDGCLILAVMHLHRLPGYWRERL